MIEFIKFNFMRLYPKITGWVSPLKRRGGGEDLNYRESLQLLILRKIN